MVAKRVPNIVRGGVAIPLKNKTNYYYMAGRKHSQGGIDVGDSPRTGLEVEDGEVMHVSKNDVKVFSSVPFLNGESPAHKVMGGENPNKVFAAQENYKDRHGINDDGTKKKARFGIIDKVPISQEELDKINNSWGATAVKLLDPTGISSWYDVKRAYDDVKAKKPGAQAELTTEIIGAIPVVGKLGKGLKAMKAVKKLSKGKQLNKAEQELYKYAIHNQKKVSKDAAVITARETIGGGKDIYDSATNNMRKFGGKSNRIYSVTSNGKTSLRMIPSTGDLLRRDKAKFGKYGKIDVSTALSNRGKIEYNFANLNKNKKDNEYKNDNIIVPRENALINNKPQYRAERNINLFNDGAAIKSGLINAGWSHGNIKNSDNIEIPNMDFTLVDKYNPKTNKNNVISNNMNKRKQVKNNVSTNRPIITTTRPNLANMAKPMDNSKIVLPDYVTIKEKPNNDDYVGRKQNNISDILGLTSNIAGSLLSHNINRNMLNKLKYSDQPIARTAAKLKTNININPQLDKMREILASYERDIDNNTASSRVALMRKQRGRLANVLSTNQLYGNKENAETELINKDRLNQQSVAHANISEYNKWREGKAAFDNAIAEKKSENDVSLIGNINTGIQDTINRREKRNSENKTIAAMAFANPNIPIELFHKTGIINNKTYNDYRKAYPNRRRNNKD